MLIYGLIRLRGPQPEEIVAARGARGDRHSSPRRGARGDRSPRRRDRRSPSENVGAEDPAGVAEAVAREEWSALPPGGRSGRCGLKREIAL